MNKLEKAKGKLKELRQNRHDYWDEHYKPINDRNHLRELEAKNRAKEEIENGMSEEEACKIVEEAIDKRKVHSDDLYSEYQHLQYKIESYSRELMSDPYFFDIVRSSSIDIHGCTLPKESFAKIVQDPINVDKLLSEEDNLANSVRKFVDSLGFKIVHSGCGSGGEWDLGVESCTEMDARRICALLHIQFRSAIAEGTLRITRRHMEEAFLPKLTNEQGETD